MRNLRRFASLSFGILAVLFIVGLLIALLALREKPRPFFRPAPGGLSIQVLGRATNFLKFDHEHTWTAFSVSNGMPSTMLYVVTEVEYRAADGWHSAGNWRSNTLTNASLMMRREAPASIPSGSNSIFYASVSVTNLPWRLRVGCFEKSWQDAPAVKRMSSWIYGAGAGANDSWSGKRYEVIGAEISP